MKLRTKNSSSRRLRTKNSLRAVRRRKRVGLERLEPRLLLAVCADGTDPLSGDYIQNDLDAPYVVNAQLCYQGDISLSSDGSVTVNAEIFSATGDVTIDSDDSVTVNAEVTAETGDIDVTADAAITINSSLTSGEAIEVTGHKTIEVYADIISDGGEVTIEAVHKRLNFGISALDQIQDLLTLGSGQLEVTIGSESDEVLISGAEGVSITAEAGINDKYNIGANPYFKNISPVVMELSGKPDLFTLPVSVQVWNPKAEVTTQNSTLVSEGGEVIVSAIAEANAKGKAVWNRVIGTGKEVGEGSGYDKAGGAAGMFFTDATATVDVMDTVISGNGVEVSTEVTNEIELDVSAITNNGLSDTNPSSVAVGFGLTDLRTTSTVHIDENSLISSSGDVKVEATGDDDTKNSVKASAYRDGVVGVAAGFTYTDATVSAVVDGKITMEAQTAAGEPETSPEPLNFNPALQVDFANSSVLFTGTTDYEIGDAILFASEDSGTIPGLIPDTVYYLVVSSDTASNSYQLQFAATAEDATNGDFIPFGDAYPTLTNQRTSVMAPVTVTVIDSQGQHLILFGYDKTLDGDALYENGDSVTFTSATDRFLGYEDENQALVGPLAEAIYSVRTVESPLAETYPLAIELLDSSGNPIALNGASYLESTSGTLYPISSYNTTEDTVDLSILSIDTSTNELVTTPPVIPVQQGEALSFVSGLNNAITTLEEGDTYYAIVDANNEGIIQLASTPSQAESSNPAVQTAQSQLTADLDGQSVSIPIGNYEMGMGLTFSTDPNIPDGTSVVYNAVAQKPINGLTDQATYLAYNVTNGNFNPAVPQYIVALVSLDATDLSTTANTGSFTLTVTDSLGTQGTTDSIAWNAAANEVGLAIEALQLPGVSVVVSGFGTPQAPWLIQGLNETAITVDSSQLLEGTSAAEVSLQQAEMGIRLGSDAVSGTFTLTYTDSSDQPQSTAPLAWDASPDQIADALNGLAGLSVSVTGMGNALSPWRIQGILPSQVATDSTELVNRFEQQATMQMTSDLQESFWYGQTLQWNDDEFTITGANVDNNDLTLLLTEEAPIVAHDGGGLENGNVSVTSVNAGATQMFSFANSGTFTLTITDPSTGTVVTTDPINWNAPAESVASAISLVTGVTVQATGSGSIASPWLISGVGAEQLDVDSQNLLNGTTQTNLLYRSTATGANVVSTTADGGTFTLTFSDGSQSIESNPIAYDATAAEMTDVLRESSSDFRAEVFGKGTAQDPWVIISLAQPIQTGEPLTFHDSWDLPSLGLVNGQTYYAVVNPPALDADMLIIGLAESPANANADPPILVVLSSALDLVAGPSAIMTGAEESITAVPESLELEISSELESGDSITSSSAIGGRPMLGYYTDGAKTRWFSKNHVDGPSAIDNEITERIPAGLKDKVNQFSVTFGVAVMDVKNDVKSVVGDTSTIGVNGDVSVTSELTEKSHTSANAGLAKQSSKNHSESSAVAVATVVAVVNNSSQAIIESDASVTGTEGVDVSSEITYPRRDSIPGVSKGGWDEAYGIIKNLALNPTVNAVESWFFNTSTNVGVKGVGENDTTRLSWILTGSVSVQDITNRNLAQIADGAQINQNISGFSWYDAATETTVQTADLGGLEETNSVSIEAKTELTQWGIAGQLYIGLNLLTLGSKDFANNVLPFQKSSRNAFGGSANFVIISEETQALLGGTDPEGNSPQNTSTNVTYGNGGSENVGLSVTAETATELIEIAQSASNSSGFGIEASTSYLLMGENDESDADRGQFTYAELNSDNLAIELTPISGTAGEVVVTAEDRSDLWAVSGAVLLGATKGIGLSASVIELKRDTSAGVGSRTSNKPTNSTNRKQAQGDFTIEASMDGTIMPLSLVGAISASRDSSIGGIGSDKAPASSTTSAASSVDGKWGLGISGDFAGAWIDDQASAYLNSPGTISGIDSEGSELSSLEITASNESIINPVAGQATISIARGNEGAMAGIAGSASVVDVQANVGATLENATIEYLTLDLEARNEKRIGNCAAGLQVQAPKGSDLQIAGSVVVNEIENITIASITNVTQSEGLGEVSLSALQLDEIWGGAGTASVTWDRRSEKPRAKTAVGVGMSAVWNQINNTTTAEVVDSTLTQSEGVFDVTAEDFTSSRVLSAGVNVTVPAGMSIEIGGMWATNYLSPSTTAQVSGSTIKNATTTDPMTVVAVLAPQMQSFAGYFSLDFGKPLSTKETQIGIGVGAAVIVARLGPKDDDGTALPTLAQVTNSTIDRLGDITVQAYTGALTDQTASFVPSQDLVESQVGEHSMHSLAIAGSAQGQNSADSSFSVGIVVNGAVVVTDMKINTQATVTTNSYINQSSSVSESQSAVQVLATNQLNVSTDAGGASVSESVSLTGTAVGIAVGGADNSFDSSNQTKATIEDSSSVIGQSVNVNALHSPTIDNFAFGVAVSVDISTSAFGAALGFSGAFLQSDQSDSVQAGISDSIVSVSDKITVAADDQSSMTTSSGAGSLQVSYGSGGSVALAPSAVTNKVTVGNSVLAWIGQQPLSDGTLIDASVASDGSVVSAEGSITVAATCDQVIANTAIAVAVSVAIAPDFDSAAGSGAGASSTVTTNNIVKAAVNGVDDLSVGGADGLSVLGTDSGSVDITVGSAAVSVGWFGASIGISLAEIVNNDQVVAEVQNSIIQTGGTSTTGAPIEIIAENTVKLTTDSVATSLSISIGASGAGGKSNITSDVDVAASFGDGSQVTTALGASPGDLKVEANSSEQLLAKIFGGSAGLGSVGVFNSDAVLGGSTSTSLDTAGSIEVNDLSVIASTDQSVISQGMSITVGGLAGTGENHNVTISESVTADVSGQKTQWDVAGDLLLQATAGNAATAQTSGSGTNTGSISASLMGVGFFKVDSTVSPVVSLSVTDVKLDVVGTSTFDSNATSQNTTEAKSGSGSLVGGDAAKATTDNSPDVSLSLTNLDLTSGKATTISGSSNANYSTNSNSVYATVAGGSAARSKNSSNTQVNVSLGMDTEINANGSVHVSADNSMSGIGDGNSLKASGFMARVGAGGGITGFGGTSASTMDGSSEIQLAQDVKITAGGRGNIEIGSSNQWQSNQLTHLGTGGAINGAGITSTLASTLTNTIELGTGVQLLAPEGQIGIGTNNNSVTTSNADSYTFGLAGGSNSDSNNEMTSTQTVTIGASSVLHAGKDIVVTAGYNPLTQTESLVDTYAIVTARCSGLLEIPTTTADARMTADNQLSIGTGSSIISHSDIEIGALPGINNASWYTFANIDGAKGKVHQGSDGLTESNSVSIDGDVIAGNTSMLSIEFPSAGQEIIVNDSPTQSISTGTETFKPSNSFATSNAFIPFKVNYNPSYDATQLLDGLDDTSKAILEPSISKQLVTAITLTDLVAVGGQIVLHAADLQGSGTVTANLPSISIANESDAYLLLDGVGIANTLNMGQVNIVGGATEPSGMTFNSTNGVPSIVVLQTYGQPVGDSASGPAIAVNDAIENTAGSVQITNDTGALVQTAPINAQTVSISTPNSAYIVSTPADYYGSSGEIKDYWTAGTSLVQEGGFESPVMTGPDTDNSYYKYNPTTTYWDFSPESGISANNTGFTYDNPDAPQGKQVAFIQFKGEISQLVASMTSGATYSLQFDAAQRGDYPDQSFNVALDGQQLCQITPSSTDYETYSCTFQVPVKELPNQESLLLTDGVNDTATAFWYQDQFEFPTSGNMIIDFTYQAGGAKAADGIAFAFQIEGVDAIGGAGGDLGYVGISGPTAAYQINLYGGHGQGSNFVTTNTSGTYSETTPVDFNSGNPIDVQLVYNVDASTVTEILTDSTTTARVENSYYNIDLSSLLGSESYIGFTGGDGGANSIQTVTNFSLTIGDSNSAPTIQGFGNWESNGSRLLTLTGLEPSGQDETVFLDNLVLSTNPEGFTPGLNSYVQQYTANLAATTAANILYLDQSGASNVHDFSQRLYNTNDNLINVNYDVSNGNPRENYPSHAKDNYDQTQQGEGIIFFGSEIPYSLATYVGSGSEYLYDGVGYLDNLSNAQTYSVAASGNSSDDYQNVTQGTGPQHDDVSPGRGIFPVVPANFPTSVSVSNPQSRSLGGSGITAGSLDVTALYLDINGPINVGAVNQAIDLVLGSDLQQQIDAYQEDFDNGSESSATMDLDSFFGTSGITGYFDALSGQIVLDPYSINAGLAEAVFTGAIISTTGFGEISVQSDPGDLSIDNQTDYPLVLENISSANQDLSGIVVFNDTFMNTSTAYLYSPDEDVRVYHGELHADIDEMTLVDSAEGSAASFQPGSDQPYVEGSVSPSSVAYQWTTDAWISRELTFEVNDGSYDLNPSSTDDSWVWGRASDKTKNQKVASDPFPSNNTVLLSDGKTDDSNAYWHPKKIDIPETGTFTVDFTYQASGDKAADGITFAFQNEGADVLGGIGGALGYVGITGPTAAYQINLYSGYTQGSNFVMTNTSGTYQTTGSVDFNSGNPINVTLVYDADAKTVTETLTDTVQQTTYTYIYEGIDLAALLGSSSYIGFTGGDGGATSIQTASDFSLTVGSSSTPSVKDFNLWDGLYHQTVVSLSDTGAENPDAIQSVTAIITQSETATTTFSDDKDDAWNYGPSTTWEWTYPTEILLRNFNQVPAANSISIDFSGVQYGSLDVDSNAELQLAGNIVFPGSVSLSSAEDLTQATNATIAATQIHFNSNGGSIGQADSPVQVNVDSSGAINANASNGIYLSSTSDLVVGQIITSTGQVELESNGDLNAAGGAPMIAGDNISLLAENGSIGSQANPITIQTKTSQLESGTITDGLLTAMAMDGVFLVQPQDDLRLLSVTTSSPLGVVSITNQTGSITDGNTSDVFQLNQFTREQAETLIDQIKSAQQNTADLTVEAFKAAVDQSYLQYWTLLPSNGAYDEQTDTFVLNAHGLAYYQEQALFYSTEEGETPTSVSDTQVQDYANLIYQNCVSIFENSLVFGETWPSLPQFQSYDIDFTFTESQETRDALTYGANDLSNSFAMLSLEALSPAGTAVLGPIHPAIETTVLDLNAGGSIGVPFHVLEIDYSAFQGGSLSNREQAIITQATTAGELQLVGVYPSGQRVEYSDGSAPDGVTPVAIAVRIDKPLFVDLAVNGLAQVQAKQSINLTEALGDLNILYAESPSDVKLVSQSNILNTPLNASSAETGWSMDANGVLGYTNAANIYTATNLTLGSPLFQMGIIENGSFEAPVQDANSFTYNPSTTNWEFSTGEDSGISGNGSGFTYDNPDAPLGSQVGLIQKQGMISQSVEGLVFGQPYNLQFDVAQRANYPEPIFTIDLDGQELATLSPTTTSYESASIPFVLNATSLELTNGQDNEANAYWHQRPFEISDSGQFSVEFIYQAGGDAAADGITFAFQKEGTNALGATGGSLGYVGISGPTAAYQINLYDGHVRGSNFVTTNASETYNPTDPIDFNSGNPIQVQLVFDADQQTVTETLTDTVQQTTYTYIYEGIDLAALLEENAYIGFTGGDGGASSTQTVTEFKLWRENQSDSPIVSGFGDWEFTGQHTLTLTGIDPSSTDQTAFIDGVKITRSPGIVSGDLRLVSGGSVGTPASPLSVQVGGELDVYATHDLNVSHQSSNNLRLHAIYSGGNATIEAALPNIFAVENDFTGSVTGFGADGNGQNWIEDAVNGSATFSSGNLLMANEAAPTDASETWHSTAVTQFKSPVTVETRFISSFVYQSSSSDADLEFVLAPEDSNLTTLAQTGDTQGTDTFALVIETQCEDCATSQAIGVRLGGQLQTISVPDEIGLASGDPIQVMMIYETLTKTVSVTLKNADKSFSSDVTGVDLLKLLGTNRAQVGFVAQGNGQASSQNISGFNFVYGAATIEAYELEITSGSQIGGTNTPVRILVVGDVRAVAPNGVYLAQIDGDLLVDSVNSDGTVQLAAPLGSVAGAGSSNPADSSLLLGAEGSAADNVPRIQAGQLRLSSLNHIGAVDTELEIGVSSLAATTVLGDINLAQFGNLSVDGGVQAGGAVRLTGDSHISVSSAIQADQEVDLKSNGGTGNLHLLPNAHVASANGLVNLSADGVVVAELGSRLESSDHVTVATGSAALDAANPHRIRLLGSITGGQLELTTGSENDSAKLSITDLIGMAGNPLAVTISQFETLHLDDVRSSTGRAYTALQDRINTDVAEVQLGEVRSVVMNLGSGDDSFQSQALSVLNSLEMHGNGGVDHFDMAAFSGGAGLAVKVVGGEHDDQLLVDGLGTPLWMVDGAVHAGDLHIDHSDVEKVLLQNAVQGLSSEQVQQLEFDALAFPEDRLLLLGTAGDDDWFVSLSPTGIQVDGMWNGTEHLRRSFDGIDYREVVFELLGGDDSLLVNGVSSHNVIVDGAKGNDWIYINESDAMITDLLGNNFITTGAGLDVIHTGPGKDKINAGDGQNVIHDAGGMNWIVTGKDDDSIYHENSDDFISASGGVNEIWLNGVLQGWHNAAKATDVNRDSNTTPLDVLLIINKLAVLDAVSDDGRYFFSGSADSLSKLYDVNGDGYMSTLDCLFVLNELGQSGNGGEGEGWLDFVRVDAPIDDKDRETDKCFANWDELMPLLIAPPQSQSDLLQAWEQEDRRRRVELESILADMEQSADEEVGLESLQSTLMRSS